MLGQKLYVTLLRGSTEKGKSRIFAENATVTMRRDISIVIARAICSIACAR